MKRRFIGSLMAAVMILGMTACGAKEEQPKPADAGELTVTEEAETGNEQEVTVTAWFYDDLGAEEAYQGWADKVHETYPWITVELECLPYDSGPEKFTVACATGETPNMYFDGYSRISAAVSGGITMDLTDVVSERKDLFVKEQVDGIVDGQYRYIATNTGAAYCLMVNLDLAKECGVEEMLPGGGEPWSYDEFLAVCRKAKEAKPDIIPLGLFAGSQSSDAWYYSLLLGNGAKICNEDLTATAFNDGESREKAIETLEFFKTLIDEEMVPNGCATMKDVDTDSLWNAGQMLFKRAAFNNMTQTYNTMEDGTIAKCNFTGLLLPNKEGKEQPISASWGTYGVCAFDNGEKADAIKKALGVYLDVPEYQSTISTATGRMSLLTTTEIEYPTEEIETIMKWATEYSAACCDSSFGILEGWWTDFRGTFYPRLQDFYIGKTDAGGMLDAWQKDADAIISEAKK